jgi:hypothetical protein
MTDLVPQAVRDLLAFYTERYPEVRFGDLDISILQHAVESIDEAAKEVIAAEEAVAQARLAFRGIEGELVLKAGRTLSFLKIFVDGDEEQLAQLEAISMAMPASRRKSKAGADASGTGEPRQRRPRKSKNTEATTTADVSADQAIEAALEKAGLTDEELTELSTDSASEEAVASEVDVVSAAPAGKKSGSKSAAE